MFLLEICSIFTLKTFLVLKYLHRTLFMHLKIKNVGAFMFHHRSCAIFSIKKLTTLYHRENGKENARNKAYLYTQVNDAKLLPISFTICHNMDTPGSSQKIITC